MNRIVVMAMDWICTFTEAFWIFFPADYLFKRRLDAKAVGKRRMLLPGFCIIGFMTLVISMNRIQMDFVYTMVAAVILCLVLLLIGWDEDPVKIIGFTGCYFMIFALDSALEIMLIGWIGGKELIDKCGMETGIERFFLIAVGGTRWCLLNFAMFLFLRKKVPVINRKNKMLYLVIAGCVGSMFLLWLQLENFQISLSLGAGLFISSLIIAFLLVYYHDKLRQAVAERRMADYQNTILEQKYDALNRFYSENAKSCHDLRHHLAVLQHLLEDGRQEEAKQYIEILEGPLQKTMLVMWTGIELIDIILSDRKRCAEEKGLAFIIDARLLSGQLKMEKTDICALLSNGLENAIEAARTEVTVLLREASGMLLLEIQNDFKQAPRQKGGRFLSTKQKPGQHGWGMVSMEDVVQKYEGTMEYSVTDMLFKVSITLPMEG